jgi:hypothetical protein
MYNYQDEDHERAFMWQSYADDDVEHGVIHDLTFFNRIEDGKYNRLSEIHYERAYELPVIKSLLMQAGFTSIEVGSDFSLEMEDKNATRWFLSVKNNIKMSIDSYKGLSTFLIFLEFKFSYKNRSGAMIKITCALWCDF